MKKMFIYSHLKGPLVVGPETIFDNWKPFKNYDVFYFILFSFWRYFRLWLDVLVKKDKVNFKIITSHRGKQIISFTHLVRSTVIMTWNKFITKWNLAHVFMMVLEVVSQKSILGNFFITFLNCEQKFSKKLPF